MEKRFEPHTFLPCLKFYCTEGRRVLQGMSLTEIRATLTINVLVQVR